MSLYSIAISLHVVIAILGLGQITGIIVLGSMGAAAPETWTALRRLVRGTTWSLVLMFLTGVLIEYATGGAYHKMMWFRLSIVLWAVVGALLGRTRRALRKAEESTLPGIVRSAWTMAAVIAAIAVLMEIKPW